MMLNLVPDVETFRTALRVIRLWAKRELSFDILRSELTRRSRDIWKRHGVSRWCGLGTAHCENVSILPDCRSCACCVEVLSSDVPMVS